LRVQIFAQIFALRAGALFQLQHAADSPSVHWKIVRASLPRFGEARVEVAITRQPLAAVK
jgi:hypothetical protein